MSVSPTYVLLPIFALYHIKFRYYSLRIKIPFKISFQCSLKVILIKKFHGTFYRVPWNFSNNIYGSMEFLVKWNSMEFCPDANFDGIPWNFFHTPEFHGIPRNFQFFRKKVPWNSMDIWQLIHKKIHIPKYCFWYLIDDYMLFGRNIKETLYIYMYIALISIS